MIHETDLSQRVLKYLRTKHPNIYVENFHVGGWTGRGAGDIHACVNGRYVVWELKVGKNHLSDAQKIKKRRLERAGGIFFSPYSFAEFKSQLEGLLEDMKT